MNGALEINEEKEKIKIVNFIKNTLKREGLKKIIIGLSGGVDSTLSFYLLKEAMPLKDIISVCLYYSKAEIKGFDQAIKKTKMPPKNIYKLSIRKPVDEIKKISEANKESQLNRVRLGNIIARVRMIMLFDLAKKHHAMVCGTENRSEYLLGYFTRFGDQACDIEPIKHLFKTQVYQLASYLGVPKSIVRKKPTAGLWPGQTDEKELGFSYKEADPVLYLYFEKKLKISQIRKKSFKNAEHIIDWALKNEFKHQAPYAL